MNILNEIKNRICWLCDICLELKIISYQQWSMDNFNPDKFIDDDDLILLEDNIMGDEYE